MTFEIQMPFAGFYGSIDQMMRDREGYGERAPDRLYNMALEKAGFTVWQAV